MTKKERILAAIEGNTPDALPYSLWTHLPGIDLDPELLAEKTFEFYKTYDIDFIKIMSNGMYPIEDFGCDIDFSEIVTGGVAKVKRTPISCPDDWMSLQVCPFTQGVLARELHSLQLVLEKVKDEEVPVLFTIFSPITIAEKLSNKHFIEHLRNGHGKELHYALSIIAETTANLAREAIRIGAAGVFFATQLSDYASGVTQEEYAEFGKPYDLQVLNACNEGWCNTLHAHGDDIMFPLLRDYPVQVFNWHVGESLPALEECYQLTGKCLMGGLQRMDITNQNKNRVQHQIYESFRQMGGKHQILTPGCVIRYPLDHEMLTFVKETKDYVEECFRSTQRV